MRRLVVCMTVCLAAFAVLVWASMALYEQLRVDSDSQQHTIAESSVPTAQLSPVPTPTPYSGPVPSTSASSPTTEAAEVVEVEILADPVGLPQSVVVMCGDDQIASAPLQASTTTGVWQPPRATAEWWSYDNWARPGVAAAEAAVIAAHVRYSGEPDAFSRLSETRVGCTVEVNYPDSVAVFEVVTDPEPIDKGDITPTSVRYGHYLYPTEPGIWLTVATCDELSGTRSDGTLERNIALKAIRIK